MKRRVADLSEAVAALPSLRSPLFLPSSSSQVLLSFIFLLGFFPLTPSRLLSLIYPSFLCLVTYSLSCQKEIMVYARSCLCMCSYWTCLFSTAHPVPSPSFSSREGSNGPEQNNGCLRESFICLRPERVPLAFHLTRQP